MSSTEVEDSPRSSNGHRNGGPGRRLNMGHGFIHFIWRNQINRDEFHKIQEERKTNIKEKLSADRRKSSTDGNGPGGQKLYVPPPLRKQSSETAKAKADSCYDSKSECPVTPACSVSDSQDENSEKVGVEKPALRLRGADRNKPRPSSEIIGDQEQEKTIREGVRRRYMRSVANVDDLCVSLTNSSILDNEREESRKLESDTLFTLQLSLKNGENVAIDVPESTQAARMAKTLSREYEFNDEQCRKLRIFIDEQLEKRISSKKQQSTSADSSE